ncbi:MAG: hypothetical protein ABL927_02415 [Bdellovibrionales bacterium]
MPKTCFKWARAYSKSLLLSIFLTGSAFFGFLPVSYSGDTNCSDLLKENANANLSMSQYNANNNRNLNAYFKAIGDGFSSIITSNSGFDLKWLDVGSGYALAPLTALSNNRPIKSTVINAQDAWGYVENGDIREIIDDPALLARITDALQIDTSDIISVWGRPLIPNYEKALRNRILEGLSKIKKTNRFDYRVGFAEEVMPTLHDKYRVLTDVFGAYFYSIDRINLLDQYYHALANQGEGFIIYKGFQTNNVGGKFKVNFSTSNYFDDESNQELLEMARKNHRFMQSLNRKLNNYISFEEVLVMLYPTIFKLEEVIYPDTDFKILHVSKDPKIPDLNLLNIFKITGHSFDKNLIPSFLNQIPHLEIQYKR